MEKTSVLAKLKQGDETSFTFVYDHYWRKVYRFSEIYLNDDEEILLFIMTRNTIFDYFRKSLNKITMKITALEVAEKIAISDETLEVKDLLEYIWKLVSLLPPRQQEVFIMSRKQQMTNKEIAEQLDISEKAVERNIYFALKFIKKNLNLFIFFITIP